MIKLERLGAAAAVLIVAACGETGTRAPRTTEELPAAASDHLAPEFEYTGSAADMLVDVELASVNSMIGLLEKENREAFDAILALQTASPRGEMADQTALVAWAETYDVSRSLPRVAAAVDAAEATLRQLGQQDGDTISQLREAIARARALIEVAETISGRHNQVSQAFVQAGGQFPGEDVRGEYYERHQTTN